MSLICLVLCWILPRLVLWWRWGQASIPPTRTTTPKSGRSGTSSLKMRRCDVVEMYSSVHLPERCSCWPRPRFHTHQTECKLNLAACYPPNMCGFVLYLRCHKRCPLLRPARLVHTPRAMKGRVCLKGGLVGKRRQIWRRVESAGMLG